ncbi:N-acetylmuramoyl-L-alanine amidase [Kalamiella sp. sgz302252]|uniref:N-acetylmuramoyl-L-alanine amidase n=1 Tax=Pantoea sp. sgz302252 TaxID=3341827 RepID=UPI0036D3584B
MNKNLVKHIKFTAAVFFSAVVITGCTAPQNSLSSLHKNTLADRGDYFADNATSAASQDSRVKFLIMHYTVESEEEAFKTLSTGKVSSHYLVSEHPRTLNSKPVITQLVAEEKRAWQAGVSNWQGRTNLNDSSIGIEIVNKGFSDNKDARTWYPYNQQQIDAVARLAQDIIKRHNIKPDYVLGHSDIAPLRKQDPGKLFPWRQLAEKGIGAWPDDATVNKYLAGRSPLAAINVLTLQQTLKQYGYDTIPQTGVLDKDTRTIISAFQMHFRPEDIRGNADAQTEAIAKALVEKYLTRS